MTPIVMVGMQQRAAIGLGITNQLHGDRKKVANGSTDAVIGRCLRNILDEPVDATQGH